MPNESKVAAGAISDLLSGLADAITQAQNKMAQVPKVDAFGRSLPLYHIPELNFTFDIEVGPSSQGSSTIFFGPRVSNSNSVSSQISGKLVSIPPNSGLPETRITAQLSDQVLQVNLSNSAGEILAQTLLSIQIDIDTTLAIGGKVPENTARLSLFNAQQVITDDNGNATIAINKGVIPANSRLVILLTSGHAEQRVTLTGGSSS